MRNTMTGLLPDKYQKYITASIIVLIVILIFAPFFQESGEIINYKKELNNEYKGLVLEKYIDASDHSICKLKFKSGEIISVWDNCYEKVVTGDSIIKKKGSFDFTIYKLSGTVIVVDIEDNLIAPEK